MREFERAPGCICNVLAVLGDGEESMRATLHAAVELAEAGHARLTLVRTYEPGRPYVWVAPFAVGAAYLPPEVESPAEAAHQLTRLVEEVPSSVSVTTMVLTGDAQSCLLKLLHERHFGAIVTDSELLRHWRRLRRQLRREQLPTVLIDGEDRTVVDSVSTQPRSPARRLFAKPAAARLSRAAVTEARVAPR